jgi:hypothetical protein
MAGTVGNSFVSMMPHWFPPVFLAFWAAVAAALALRVAWTTGDQHTAARTALRMWLPWALLADVLRQARRGDERGSPSPPA